MMDVTDTKQVFVVWTNTDLTEGKGRQYPLYVCESKTTALRVGKNAGVQGSSADIYADEAYMMDGRWYAPSNIMRASLADKKIDQARQRSVEIVDKAKKLGLSNEDIVALSKVEWEK